MTPREFEQFLRANIPLASAMAVEVATLADASVVLQAPLAPNINPHGTVFGGSAAAVAILAAWSVVHVRLRAAGHAGSEVIQGNTMEYLRPITGTFTARATLARPEEWGGFERLLLRRGRARIEVAVTLEQNGEVAARSVAQIVALREDH